MALPKGRAKPYRKSTRLAMATKIVEEQLDGKTWAEISAKHGGISRETIRKYIKYAEEEGIIGALREQVFTRLVPKAIGLYEKVLEADPEKIDPKFLDFWKLQLEAARDNSFGSGVLRKEPKPRPQAAAEEHSLERYYQLREQAPPLVAGEIVTSVEEEAHAQGLRTYEGTLHRGGDVREGRQGEGGKNLERQTSQQSSDPSPQERKEGEVG